MGCLDPNVLLKRGAPYSFGFGTDAKEFRKYQRSPFRWFAEAIAKQFPPEQHRRVADVAGGPWGHSARALKAVGYRVVVMIDPSGRRLPGMSLRKRKFRVHDALEFDLLVGFRPCGASQKLIRAAKQVPLAFLPCGCGWVWPSIVSRGKKYAAAPMSGATKFFHICGVPFTRVGPVFMSRPALR